MRKRSGIPKFIQKYQCLFCGDLFNYELPAIEHEKECRYNPEAKEKLLAYLEYDKHQLENRKASILYDIEVLNEKINKLREEIK